MIHPCLKARLRAVLKCSINHALHVAMLGMCGPNSVWFSPIHVRDSYNNLHYLGLLFFLLPHALFTHAQVHACRWAEHAINSMPAALDECKMGIWVLVFNLRKFDLSAT